VPPVRRVWIGLAVASIGWGTGGVATRAALGEGVGPYAVAGVRSVLASLIVIGFLVVRRAGVPRTPESWKVGMMMATTNLAIPFVLTNIALQYASAGFIGLTTALIPLITAGVAHFALANEPMTLLKLIGLVIGFSGVAALLVSGDSGLADGGRPITAGLLALVAVVSIAVGGVYAKHHAGKYTALEVTGVHFVVGSVLIVIAMLAAEGMPSGFSTKAWVLLAYMAAFSTFVPFAIYYWLLRVVSATFASLAGYMVPVVSVVAGMLFLDERLQAGLVLGGLLILVGVVVTERAEYGSTR
jgi:drug/metabolite transporter (DMT)-like permease